MEIELTTTNIIMMYLILINVIAFFIYGWDKYCAKKNMWRVSEKKLLLIGVFGGCIGAYIGMQCFRHKTQHLKFKYGIPIIYICQIAIAIIVFKFS